MAHRFYDVLLILNTGPTSISMKKLQLKVGLDVEGNLGKECECLGGFYGFQVPKVFSSVKIGP